MPMAKRFQILTPCAGCQSFHDGKEFFSELERLGNDFELPPDRIARALVPLLADWTAAAARYAAGGPVDEAAARAIIASTMRATEYALETYFDLVPEAAAEHRH
jgi:hypothetical protein